MNHFIFIFVLEAVGKTTKIIQCIATFVRFHLNCIKHKNNVALLVTILHQIPAYN